MAFRSSAGSTVFFWPLLAFRGKEGVLLSTTPPPPIITCSFAFLWTPPTFFPSRAADAMFTYLLVHFIQRMALPLPVPHRRFQERHGGLRSSFSGGSALITSVIASVFGEHAWVSLWWRSNINDNYHTSNITIWFFMLSSKHLEVDSAHFKHKNIEVWRGYTYHASYATRINISASSFLPPRLLQPRLVLYSTCFFSFKKKSFIYSALRTWWLFEVMVAKTKVGWEQPPSVIPMDRLSMLS